MATTSSIVPLTPTKIDTSKIGFGKIKPLGTNKVSMVPVLYNGRFMVVQTPETKVPYPPSNYKNNEEDDDKNGKETIDMYFQGFEKRPSVQSFLNFLKDLQEKAINYAIENSESLFGCNKEGQAYKPEFVREFFTSTIREPMKKDEKGIKRIIEGYPPFIRLPLNKKDGNYTCKIVDNKQQPMELTHSNSKGSFVTAIIQCSGIWIGNKQFGLSWQTKMLRVVPPMNSINLSFMPEEDRLAEDESNDRGNNDNDFGESENKPNFASESESDDDNDMMRVGPK